MNYIDVVCALCIAAMALPPLASRGVLISKREAAATARSKTLCALAAETELYAKDCAAENPENALNRWPQASLEIEEKDGSTIHCLRIDALGRPWYFSGGKKIADEKRSADAAD